MEDEKILIDRKTLKAISSDTRMDILKYLSKRKYTLSEISKKLNLKDPTVKEHLEHLISSNLVKKEETENKWKYYSLTEKGKKLINPKEIKILISFVISFIATIGIIGYYIINYVFKSNRTMTMERARDFTIQSSMDTVGSSQIYNTPLTTSGLGEAQTQIISNTNNSETLIIIAIFIFISITIFLLIIIIKDRKEKDCIKIID